MGLSVRFKMLVSDSALVERFIADCAELLHHVIHTFCTMLSICMQTSCRSAHALGDYIKVTRRFDGSSPNKIGAPISSHTFVFCFCPFKNSF